MPAAIVGSTAYLTNFWNKVHCGGPQECWEWRAVRNPLGYGQFRTKTGMSLAHRVAWTFSSGDDPRHLVVMHTCDNPPCVNPSHLRLGTVVDNNRDRAHKGRGRNGREGRTLCKHGHPLEGENLYLWRGWRLCRQCRAQRSVEKQQSRPRQRKAMCSSQRF